MNSFEHLDRWRRGVLAKDVGSSRSGLAGPTAMAEPVGDQYLPSPIGPPHSPRIAALRFTWIRDVHGTELEPVVARWRGRRRDTGEQRCACAGAQIDVEDRRQAGDRAEAVPRGVGARVPIAQRRTQI